MKNSEGIQIIKSSGDLATFSKENLRKSLAKSGASDYVVKDILAKVESELYPGISTREIHNRAYALLKKQQSVFASKYKLKKALYELGPTGFPFEKFIGALLEYSGYKTRTDVYMQGACVNHEVDVLAEKNGAVTVIECKFHGEEGRNCNVKIPLYINSRFMDIKAHWNSKDNHSKKLEPGWVVTNTRFTKDALQYGKCAGLYLLSWDHPAKEGLKDRIDRLGLYPITVSGTLSKREKQFLLSRDVVLCRQLIKYSFFLDHLGISANRKEKIMKEIEALCQI